jgi:peptidoglycan/xylan/chitin deacetylase (PgdA/CDA1 family)
VLLVLVWPHAPLAGVGLLAVSHALILYPTLRPNVQWLGPVVTRFASEGRQLWLTIDDGPSEDTPEVLDLLERRGVRATFFVKGALAQQRPDLVQRILERGHTVANHTQTHPSGTFWCSLPGRVALEIDECNRALVRATGSAPTWFRAPVGMKNPAVHPLLRRRGMRLIGWTARGFDAVIGDPEQVLARIVPQVVPGGIIVLHQGREHSLRVLERVILDLESRGYTFVIPDDAQLRTG